MKKLLCLLLSAVMIFCLPGCGEISSLPDSNSSAIVNSTEENISSVFETEEETSEAESTATEEFTSIPEESQPPDEESKSTIEKTAVIQAVMIWRSTFTPTSEAQDLGWSGGSLEPYAPGKCIGGNRFGNYEGLLPEKEGRKYTECDIDTLGADSRGAKRIVFSNAGLIYYTDDHYESFTLLYGEE